MSQNDLSVADAAGAAFRADVNSALQALGTLQSGASAPGTTYAYMYWADTTSGQLKQRNAANSGWIVRATLAESFVLSRSSNTILAEADREKTLIATAGFTQTLTAAATLGDGWAINIIVDSGATLVIDPNGSETVDGATTKSIVGPAQGRLVCNGTLFRTIGLDALPSSGYFAARAWVNFNGTGTVAIRASGNVSSITDNGTGDYTVNFTTAMSDANYAPLVTISGLIGTRFAYGPQLNTIGGAAESAPTTSAFRFLCMDTSGAAFDPKYVSAAAFR